MYSVSPRQFPPRKFYPGQLPPWTISTFLERRIGGNCQGEKLSKEVVQGKNHLQVGTVQGVVRGPAIRFNKPVSCYEAAEFGMLNEIVSVQETLIHYHGN